MPNETQIKKEPSELRKRYIIRFIGRIIVLVIATLLFFFKRDEFDVLEGFNFFRKFSLFHLLWGIWVVDMLLQLIPVKNHISLGSQKHLRYHFQMAKERINIPALKKYISSITRSAYKVMILWVALIAVIAGFYYTGVFTKAHLLMISVLFYVFDLVCVLIWCPFRLIMGNKCCTTCRIFNWDHFMMFSPVIFAGGFYVTKSVIVYPLYVPLCTNKPDAGNSINGKTGGGANVSVPDGADGDSKPLGNKRLEKVLDGSVLMLEAKTTQPYDAGNYIALSPSSAPATVYHFNERTDQGADWDRHNLKTNVLIKDGHVETLGANARLSPYGMVQ